MRNGDRRDRSTSREDLGLARQAQRRHSRFPELITSTLSNPLPNPATFSSPATRTTPIPRTTTIITPPVRVRQGFSGRRLPGDSRGQEPQRHSYCPREPRGPARVLPRCTNAAEGRERCCNCTRLEQSRIVFAMRLAEHQGKKHKVIEEALVFVGDISTAGPFISPDNLYPSAPYPPGENFVPHEEKRSSNLIKFLINSFNFAKKSLKLDQMGGIFGNAALVAISMLALLHLQQGACEVKYVLDLPQKQEDIIYSRNARQVSRREDSSSSDRVTHTDVMLTRG